MIIDSHTHYANFQFDREAPRLCEQNGEYAAFRASREELIEKMKSEGIVGVIEPSIELENIEKQIDLAKKHSGWMRVAVGVHPTRAIRTDWEDRKTIDSFAKHESVVAIGETGLDYHYKRFQQHRKVQKKWFLYQLELAHRHALPLVLHIRNADKDALAILKKHREKLHGGVAHCFTGDDKLAKKYVELGFVIGIGGKLLGNDSEAMELCRTVKYLPPESIVVETDAPLVIPKDVKKEIVSSTNQWKKLSNSSLILARIIRKIAEIRGEDTDAVALAVYRNTLRAFDLE